MTPPTHPANPDALLARELGVRQLGAGIFNYIVASGIFALPAFAAVQLGAAAPLAYLACALLMGLVVVCLAEAGSRVSATGGPSAYVDVALGPLAGLVAGALLLLTDLSATAAVSSLFAGSFLRLFGAADTPTLRAIVTMALLVALAATNVRGVRAGSRVIEMATVAKLLPLLLFVFVGAASVNTANLAWTDTPSVGRVLGTSGLLIFAFAGIEAALIPSGEVRDPARTVPRAAFLALGVVTLLYLAVQAVALGILGPALATDRVAPLASAAERVAGAPGRTLLVAGATVSMFGYLSGAMLAAPRNLFAFGRDGFAPRALAAVHPRYRTPYVAIVVYVILVLALALTGTFERLAILANVAALTLYFLCAVSAWELRRRDVRVAGGSEPFRAPGGPLIPALACGAVAWLLWATVTRREIIAVGAVLAVALVAYAIRSTRARRAPAAEAPSP